MKNAVAVSVVSFLALAATANAAISVIGNNLGGSGRVLTDAAGTELPTGSLVRVGFFNDPVADIAVISGTNFSDIDQLFNPLGEGAVNSGAVTDGALAVGDAPGRFNFTVSGILQSYLPQNKLMFYWVFNASSAASASQWAIFTNDDSNDTNDPWLSKLDDAGIPGSGDITLAVQQSRVDDETDVITGTLEGTQLRLEVIPEPGLGALCLTATALLFRRRRPTGPVS